MRPLLWFLVKLVLVVYALIWIRATVPRFRYDRLMSLGWKALLPLGLLWILVTAASVVLPGYWGNPLRAGIVVFSGTVVVLLLLGPAFAAPPRGAEPMPLERRGG